VAEHSTQTDAKASGGQCGVHRNALVHLAGGHAGGLRLRARQRASPDEEVYDDANVIIQRRRDAIQGCRLDTLRLSNRHWWYGDARHRNHRQHHQVRRLDDSHFPSGHGAPNRVNL